MVLFFSLLLQKNKQFRSSLLTMILALVSVFTLLLAMFQVNAWFKNFQTAETDAVLTNFDTKIEYSVGSNTWKVLEDNTGIPLIIQGDTAKLDVSRIDGITTTPSTLQIRITYTGKSNAFIRFSAFGNFYNADTKTYLPQKDGLWSVTGTNWVKNNGYWYYKQKVGCAHNETLSVGSFSDTHVLKTLTVTLDTTKLASTISPHQDYQGDLYFYVDAVQPDRFQEFWGIETLPFSL